MPSLLLRSTEPFFSAMSHMSVVPIPCLFALPFLSLEVFLLHSVFMARERSVSRVVGCVSPANIFDWQFQAVSSDFRRRFTTRSHRGSNSADNGRHRGRIAVNRETGTQEIMNTRRTRPKHVARKWESEKQNQSKRSQRNRERTDRYAHTRTRDKHIPHKRHTTGSSHRTHEK